MLELPYDGQDPWGDAARAAWQSIQDNITGHGVNVKDLGGGQGGDDTDLINAIAADLSGTGGVVYLPPGMYMTSDEIVLPSGVSLRGAGSLASVIFQSNTAANGITNTSTGEVNAQQTISDLCISGPFSGTGQGVHVGFVGTGAPHPMTYLRMKNVRVHGFGSHAVHLSGAIVSQLDNVICELMGGHGFWLDGGYVEGAGESAVHYGSWVTSTVLTACYANYGADQTTGKSGYRVDMATYVGFNGCATDWAGIGYDLNDVSCAVFNNCGAEATKNKGVDYPGYGFRFNGSSTFGTTAVNLVGCYSTETASDGYRWEGYSSGNMIGSRYFTSAGSPPNSINVVAPTAAVLAIGCILPAPRNIAGQFLAMEVTDAVGDPTGLTKGPNSPKLLPWTDSIQILNRGPGTNVPLLIRGTSDQGAGLFVIQDNLSQNLFTFYQNTNTPAIAFGHDEASTIARPDGVDFLSVNKPFHLPYYASVGALPPAANYFGCLAIVDTAHGMKIVLSNGVTWLTAQGGGGGNEYWQTVV